jgi:hypothetical protein
MLQLTFPRKDTYTILITYFPQIYCMVAPVKLDENYKRILVKSFCSSLFCCLMLPVPIGTFL